MRRSLAPRILAVLASLAVLVGAAAASGAVDGGSGYPSATGGSTYGRIVTPVRIRPVVGRFVVSPRQVREGRMPIVRYRIDEEATARVRVRVAVVGLRGAGSRISAEQGLRRVGETWRVRWGPGRRLAPGRYLVRLHVRDPKGRTLLRSAHASGLVGLRVLAAPRPKPVVAPKPTPASGPVVPPAPAPAPVTPTPVSGAGAFPVAGPYSYGDPFGTPRRGYSHQGQDLSAVEGTPVVAPTAGTITFRDYQANAAGFYLVERSVDGRSFFFAHCQADTFAVTAGAAVAAGQQLCRVGQTGDATGPHLHFEIWDGPWRQGGRPVDPLAQLKAWAR